VETVRQKEGEVRRSSKHNKTERKSQEGMNRLAHAARRKEKSAPFCIEIQAQGKEEGVGLKPDFSERDSDLDRK